jgi:hypothetical protein
MPSPAQTGTPHALLGEVVPTIAAGDLWFADRNFCVRAFLSALRERRASFIIRQHGTFNTKPLAPMNFVGRSPSGAVYEQDVEIADAAGKRSRLRRVSVKLTAPTRNGDTTLVVLTDLPREGADAVAAVELYRTRWRIELDLRNIKMTLGMEQLRCNTLAMARKELWVYVLAYNPIRLLMARAALLADQIPCQLSFKHTVHIWIAWQQRAGSTDDAVVLHGLPILITQPRVGLRPGRLEPRARKQRAPSRSRYSPNRATSHARRSASLVTRKGSANCANSSGRTSP